MEKLWKKIGVVILFLIVCVQLTPFYISIITAIKSKTDLTSRWFFPKAIYWHNFVVAIERGQIFNAMKNSLIVTSVSLLGVILIGSLAAYPLARIKSRFNTFVMMIIVGVMMIPPLSVLVPLYSMMNQLKGVNTYWGIILLMTTGQLSLSIFLYRNFITTIPLELEEAARIDGANYMQIFFKIIMPLIKPVTASVIILSGTFVWNDYQLSLYMLPKPAMRTITTAIASFFSQQGSNMGAAAAASLMAMAPIVLLYLFLQKYFIKGMIDSAIK